MPAFVACHGSCALREIVLINITGEDRPGLTAAITGVLAQGGVNILDIGQAVIHDTLSFGILIEIPDNERASSVLKDVLFMGYKHDQQVRFTPVADYTPSGPSAAPLVVEGFRLADELWEVGLSDLTPAPSVR